MKTSKIAVILLVIALLIASLHPTGIVVPVYAQEATSEPTEPRPIVGVAEETEPDTATGLTAGVLLIGLLAVAAVGGLSLLRENYRAQQE
jgi:hypothetical protein